MLGILRSHFNDPITDCFLCDVRKFRHQLKAIIGSVGKIPALRDINEKESSAGNYPGRKIKETRTWKPDDYDLDGMAMKRYFHCLCKIMNTPGWDWRENRKQIAFETVR